MSNEAYRRYLVRARDALHALVTGVLADVPAQVRRSPTAGTAQRTARAEVADALSRYPAPCIAGFAESFDALIGETLSAEPSKRFDLDSLSIMDDLRVQEEVEVVDASRILADEAGVALVRLRRLEAALQARFAESALSPVGPATLARALWRATERLPISVEARSEAVRAAVRLLAPRLGPAYVALRETTESEEALVALPEGSDKRLVARQALPGASPSEPAGPAMRPPTAATAAEVPGFDVTRPGALGELLSTQSGDDRDEAADSTLAVPLEGEGTKIPRLVQHHRAGAARDAAEAGMPPAHRLVGRIFDEIVGDPELSGEGAAWIGRLQPAVLHLAEVEPAALLSHRHPAWLLVNDLASLFNDEPSRRPPNLDAWLERAVLMLHAHPGRDSFEAVGRRLASWRAARARRSLTEMRPAVELLQRHALLEEGVEAARRRLERRLDASRADEAVRRFVSSIWALKCAQAEAAGDTPDHGQPDAWDTATDLIWSTSPARSRLDSPTLMAMIPDLVRRLVAGMEALGIEEAVRQAWLDRLAELHLRALQRAPEEAQTDMPLTIDLALEDMHLVESPPAPGAGVVSSEATGLADDAGAARDPIDALEIGDRLALQIQGEWNEVSLVWRSENRHFLLLALAKGRSISVTRRSLQRLLSEGLARLPDAGSALARAAGRLAGA